MSAKIKNITLELSSKAFTDDSQFTMYNVCRKMFTQWKLLTDRVATPFVINPLFGDFSLESFREFITFFQNFNRVTHSSRSDSDELEDPFSSERELCITLRFRHTQFYRKFVTLAFYIFPELQKVL